MEQSIQLLTITAATIAFTHTLFGPDHYLPFIVMARARKWNYFKTIWITILCGIGHVGSSIVVGIIGVATGIGIARIEFFEGYRGGLAAWAFIIFGLIYFIWGMIRAYRNKPHKHVHEHSDGEVHIHEHSHDTEHDHVHKKNITPWILFVIFVLGPCEPLIPILMYPAAEMNTGGLILVTSVFASITILTMLGVVLFGVFGLKNFSFGKAEKYSHAIAGAIIFLPGF